MSMDEKCACSISAILSATNKEKYKTLDALWEEIK